MFTYHLDLALRSLRRGKALTALMVLAIAMGIGASMTTLTIYVVLAGDPVPGRSATLYHVQLDHGGADGYAPGVEPDEQLTRFDAEALLRDARGERQAMMNGGRVAVTPEAPASPFFSESRYTSADFFPMFGVPVLYGRVWSKADDDARERVVVLSRALNQRLFAGADSVGRSVTIEAATLRVIGVLDDWRPTPHFYDLHVGAYRDLEGVFMPFTTSRDLNLAHSGSMSCWGDRNQATADDKAVNAPCSWIQYWVQLRDADHARDYQAYLERYSEAQRADGRYFRPPNVRLRTVKDWLAQQKVVPDDARLQVGLAFGFLLVCLVNTVGLLLAKCLRRAPEIGVRRALGASRRAIFSQFLVEAGLIGVLGGLVGLLFAGLGLVLVGSQQAGATTSLPVDWPVLAAIFALELGATLVAGLLPAWRACQVTPALQLKSQ